ncbi:long-chain-fatty-acid--CoA ligase [Enteractinococcus coprophilus]|uniref:Fatty-acyl-CoA synthase n=1 Tax=Enteractinococcus coprophilus TaxID=1027633 RepID=A0A543ANJ8_9MICC|nr:long-chain-fatty-acid--CoA ligase [Enteractinococcus coprophilus]TQL74151.1 fatty-acyl-CoA synthase [Enteractinococcus coprophilus]
MANVVHGYPSTMQDDYQLTMGRLIRQAVRSFGDTEIVHRDSHGQWGRTTYQENFDRIERAAAAFDKLGVGLGDRVGVMDWNSLRHYELYWAIPAIGAVFTQLNLRLAPEDLLYVINDSQASVIAVDETLVPAIQTLAERAKGVKTWVILSEGHIEHTLPNAVYYEDLIADVEPLAAWPNISETSAFAAGYTTGTTGRPKGVFYSHRSQYLHSYNTVKDLTVSNEDVVMPITPMFHVLSWGMVQVAVMVGAKLVLPGMFSAETLGEITGALTDEGVTVTNGVPAIFTPMLEVLKSKGVTDLTGLRMLCGGSEPPNSLITAYRETFNAEVVHGWGATETSPIVTVNRLRPTLRARMSQEEQQAYGSKQGSFPVNVDYKIVDGMGNEVPDDGVTSGEVLLKGPWITASYHGMPAEDLATKFVDGYWRSGDVASIDENGFIKITDRLKDVIKSGGEWISSIDMENLMVSHPKVVQAAVVGLEHPKWDERPFMLLVLQDGDDITREEIDEHLLQRFAKWQLPEEFKVVDKIPATSVGKIDKKVIRREYKDLYQ